MLQKLLANICGIDRRELAFSRQKSLCLFAGTFVPHQGQDNPSVEAKYYRYASDAYLPPNAAGYLWAH
jgi:hypothetical protein